MTYDIPLESNICSVSCVTQTPTPISKRLGYRYCDEDEKEEFAKKR